MRNGKWAIACASAVMLGGIGMHEVEADTNVMTDTTQSGGTFAVDNDALVIHGNPTPLLTLSNGATTSGVQAVVIGVSSGGGSGSLRVEGGSTLTNNEGMGAVYYDGEYGQARNGYIGFTAGGTATITGVGSTWTNEYDLHVGFDGVGSLVVEDGGQAINANGRIADEAGGSALITGNGSKWTNSGYLGIGPNQGSGTLNVQAGGYVSSDSGFIRYGSATITGSGSKWDNTNSLSVGNGSTGILIVQDGAQVSSSVGYVGGYHWSAGTATITGTGSRWTNTGDFFMSGDNSHAFSEVVGTTNVETGGTLDVGGTLKVWNKGDSTNGLRLQGGTVKAGTLDFDNNVTRFNTNWTGGTLFIDGGSVSNLDAALTVPAAGTLKGTGTIAGSVTNDGTFAPGNSPGLMTITGGLTQNSGATLLMELGGTTTRGTDYDALDITGGLSADGTLEVLLVNSYTPQAGDSFDLLDFGSFNGDFSYDLPNLQQGLDWDTSAISSTGVLSVVAVPEPGTLTLLGIGAAALLMRRRRESKSV
ncbi:MAG: PEP-CTERM sorting domain-containing protein [Phycisphaerales bacterium]|nr:PEP-CTERM sorting domain-containing protein [Phycisphaerales bacterium]